MKFLRKAKGCKRFGNINEKIENYSEKWIKSWDNSRRENHKGNVYNVNQPPR